MERQNKIQKSLKPKIRKLTTIESAQCYDHVTVKLFSRILCGFLLSVGVPFPSAWACACGCAVFDVSTSSMLPTHPGGMIFFDYYFLNQIDNWSGNSSAPAADNNDKRLRSHFFTLGTQYMFSRSWGVMMEFPVTIRHFTTAESGSVESFDHAAIGDVRVSGIYSGFSDDMSTGVIFGLKLPTGDHTYPDFDHDTAIGSGSTDTILGAYHLGNITGAWNWYANVRWDMPFLIQYNYRPGTEINAVAGIYYHGFRFGEVKIVPISQTVGSYRYHDRGNSSDPDNTGYERIILSPGIEIDVANMSITTDVGFPVFEHVRGNQLVAPQYYKFSIAYAF